MSERVYIGARYVPLFMGEWDNTKSYEPLSIVSNDGNSYTSRQAVPVGIDIDNTVYWAMTGVIDAQVGALSNRMDAAESDIDALEGVVGDSSAGLVKDVADNSSDIAALQATVGDSSAGLVKDVSDNTSDITVLQAAVGDSDSGLIKAVTDNANAIDALETTVGDNASGLVADVAELMARPRELWHYSAGVDEWENGYTKTIDGVSDYHLFAAVRQGATSVMIGMRAGNKVHAIGGFTDANGDQYIQTCDLSFSGDDVTLSACGQMKHTHSDAHATFAQFNVGILYGIC